MRNMSFDLVSLSDYFATPLVGTAAPVSISRFRIERFAGDLES